MLGIFVLLGRGLMVLLLFCGDGLLFGVDEFIGCLVMVLFLCWRVNGRDWILIFVVYLVL